MHTAASFPLLTALLILSLSLSPSIAADAASFCKCICFNNSTIIALNPSRSSTPSSAARSLLDDADALQPRSDHHLTCSDCNRAFCLSYNLPICKDATDNDVFTTCFQRDSLKDKIVVVLFLVATTGLLGWALLRPWVDQLKEKHRLRYLPLGGGGDATGVGVGRNGR